jgi:membrane protein
MYYTALKKKLQRLVGFLKGDVWRIRSRDLPRMRSLLLKHLRILLLAVRGFSAHRCSLHASSLTFFTILSIVPAVAMLFGVAKGFVSESVLEERLTAALPGQEDVAAQLIEFSRSMLANARGSIVAGVGVAVLFWTVIKVLTHVEKSFNTIWGVKENRPLGRRFTDYLSIMIICPVLLIASGGITVAISSKVESLVDSVAVLGFLGPFVSLLLRLLPYCIGWGLFAFICIFMPNTKVKLASGVFGGIVAGTIYQLMQGGYVSFQIGVAKYSAIYGGLAALPLFLIWLQLSWLVVLFGAELSFAHQNVETYEFEPDCLNARPSFKRLLALRMTQMLVRNFSEGGEPLNGSDIAHALGVPIRLVNDVLYELVQTRILAETKCRDLQGVGYQPACAIDRLTIGFVLEALDNHGTEAIPMLDSPELSRLADSLREFRSAIRSSEANIALKDV